MKAIPYKYVQGISNRNISKQKKEIERSRKEYKKKRYYTRKPIKSFKTKKSSHVKKAKNIYSIHSINPSQNLANKTKCHINGLREIVKKGQGAYYSSGSRPSQTAHSWGIARLASSITGGKSSGVDLSILTHYCHPKSKVLKLAQTPKQGRTRTKKYISNNQVLDKNN